MQNRESSRNMVEEQTFQDFLPHMAEKLGADGLISELCNGFRLIMDPTRGLITWESLKRKAEALGMEGMTEEEAREMVREGDLDGDGALDQMEFCVLMVRLSPGLMERLWRSVDDSLSRQIIDLNR
ncbi:calcium-binding protein KIC-like [Nymphaea colorata]|nr:calcium-binding protein KIC-like [Nymphaea colorata]